MERETKIGGAQMYAIEQDLAELVEVGGRHHFADGIQIFIS